MANNTSAVDFQFVSDFSNLKKDELIEALEAAYSVLKASAPKPKGPGKKLLALQAIVDLTVETDHFTVDDVVKMMDFKSDDHAANKRNVQSLMTYLRKDDGIRLLQDGRQGHVLANWDHAFETLAKMEAKLA
jgi:hypothetical protein